MRQCRYLNSEIKYEYLGYAMPAGRAKGNMPVIQVYRLNATGRIFYRTVEDFAERMEMTEDDLSAKVEHAKRCITAMVENQDRVEQEKRIELIRECVTAIAALVFFVGVLYLVQWFFSGVNMYAQV